MNTKYLGNVGEDIACKFLERRGFVVVARNYQRKWGEIDIIAREGQVFHFCEVKSMKASHASRDRGHRPEDNVHRHKTQRIRRMIETYLSDIGQGIDAPFEFHVLSVYINMQTRCSQVYWLRNIII
jgi:putative endonuclease